MPHALQCTASLSWRCKTHLVRAQQRAGEIEEQGHARGRFRTLPRVSPRFPALIIRRETAAGGDSCLLVVQGTHKAPHAAHARNKGGAKPPESLWLPTAPAATPSPRRAVEPRAAVEPGASVEAVRAVKIRPPPAASPWVTHPADLFDVGSVVNERQPIGHGGRRSGCECHGAAHEQGLELLAPPAPNHGNAGIFCQGAAPAWPEEPHAQGRIDVMGTRSLRYTIRKLHVPPSRKAEFNPNPQKPGYPAPPPNTFLVGANLP